MQTGFTGNLTVAGTPLTNVATVQVPFGSVKIVEFSAINQANNYIQKLGTMIDPGTVAFTSLYAKADYNALGAVKATTAEYVITTPTGTNLQTFTFSGILTKCDVEMTAESLMEIKGEIVVTGAIVVS